jgi:hypothetical protein
LLIYSKLSFFTSPARHGIICVAIDANGAPLSLVIRNGALFWISKLISASSCLYFLQVLGVLKFLDNFVFENPLNYDLAQVKEPQSAIELFEVRIAVSGHGVRAICNLLVSAVVACYVNEHKHFRQENDARKRQYLKESLVQLAALCIEEFVEQPHQPPGC